jgi:cell division cycle 20-like protein 1, cofactor of APC complex
MAPASTSELKVATSNGRVDAGEVHTPTLISPPDSKTPPTVTNKRHQDAIAQAPRDSSSEPVDAHALSKALDRLDQTGRQREHTPGGSPSRKRQRVYGDRYVKFYVRSQ